MAMSVANGASRADGCCVWAVVVVFVFVQNRGEKIMLLY